MQSSDTTETSRGCQQLSWKAAARLKCATFRSTFKNAGCNSPAGLTVSPNEWTLKVKNFITSHGRRRSSLQCTSYCAIKTRNCSWWHPLAAINSAFLFREKLGRKRMVQQFILMLRFSVVKTTFVFRLILGGRHIDLTQVSEQGDISVYKQNTEWQVSATFSFF